MAVEIALSLLLIIVKLACQRFFELRLFSQVRHTRIDKLSVITLRGL